MCKALPMIFGYTKHEKKMKEEEEKSKAHTEIVMHSCNTSTKKVKPGDHPLITFPGLPELRAHFRKASKQAVYS